MVAVISTTLSTDRSSVDAQLPESFVGLKLDTLKALPLNFNHMAITLEKAATGITVELLSLTGPVRSWTLVGGQSDLEAEHFKHNEVSGSATVSKSTLSLDLQYSGVIRQTGGTLLRLVGLSNRQGHAHVSVEFKASLDSVVVHLNDGVHLSLKLPGATMEAAPKPIR